MPSRFFDISLGILFIFLYSLIPFSIGVCIPINTTTPQFSGLKYDARPVSLNRLEFLHCCVYGVTKITWWYRPQSPNSTYKEIVPGVAGYSFWSERILIVNMKVNNGKMIYKCIGTDDYNRSITHEITVTFVQTEGGKNIEIESSGTDKIGLQIHSNVTLYCYVKVFYSFISNFMWTRIKHSNRTSILPQSGLRKNLTNSSLIGGYKGWSSLTYRKHSDQYFGYNFTLTFYDLRLEDEGNYSCLISFKKTHVENQFQIHIEQLKPAYFSVATGMTLCLIGIIVFLYFLRYDIKILVKYCFRKVLCLKAKHGKYNFFFIYNFDDLNELKTIYNVISKIESCGYTTYFYHRDQIYGMTVLEDLVTNLIKSDVVVFWVSRETWKDSTTSFCLHMLTKKFPKKRRLYVLTESKASAMELCENKVVLMDTKSCTSSKTIQWNPTNIIQKSSIFLKVWKWHYILSWLKSSLPVYPVK